MAITLSGIAVPQRAIALTSQEKSETSMPNPSSLCWLIPCGVTSMSNNSNNYRLGIKFTNAST